ncbi:sialidase family protein [Algoriphagus sediminis]|uniref:exo-alpha-sialidase n=1 Tax=Algoriphagus sediminis TaxID=3057113 RepID=A0ABT7YGF5_9BACT|nr:sialidase family protein [Algoriphagus sediminis]MDN3205611.1 sialidase family protein [Algoriphagus sediminis]
MQVRFVVFLLLFFFIGLTAKAQETIVYKGGQEGHAIYRIPAIISLPNQDLLAFAEGRVNGTDDFGDINLVMKRSADGGETWSEIQTLVDYDSLQAGNPAPVVDLFDSQYPEGVIYLFYNTGNNHEYEVRTGNGIREVWMIKSLDLGKTWEKPVNITTQTHRPNQPEFNPNYKFKEDWRHYANTPGHAFQFKEGKFRGRIFVAANHSKGGPEQDWSDYQAHGFYTDDHGESFHLSESISIPGSNESIAAELPDNRMIMSIRNQKGDIRQRIIAFSEDGGKSWSEEYFDENLTDPVCQSSILSFRDREGKTILIHSNNDHPTQRNNLTIKFSKDLGRTWKENILVESKKNLESGSWTGYSDLVFFGQSKLGILYERDNYGEIIFKSY